MPQLPLANLLVVSLEQAVAALAPEKYGDADIETLVQTITDQIMAAAQ